MEGDKSTTPNQPLYATDADSAENGPPGTQPKKSTPTIVRVFVVLLYLFTVSFAALGLSAYYIFFWTPKQDLASINNPARLMDCGENNIVIPDHLAVQLANRSEVPAELFYTNLYRNLIHSKTIKARKSAAINESSNLTRLIQQYRRLRDQSSENLSREDDKFPLHETVVVPAVAQPTGQSPDIMIADEDDGGDDYEQSGNYGLYSNHTTIQLDPDELQQ